MKNLNKIHTPKKALKTILCVLFFLQTFDAQSQYLAKITNLNSQKVYYLKKGEKYYFQLLKSQDVVYLEFWEAQKDNLIFENKKINPDDLSWLSKTYYKNSKVSEMRRNSTVNLGVLPRPTFDFEEKHFIEIVPDSSFNKSTIKK